MLSKVTKWLLVVGAYVSLVDYPCVLGRGDDVELDDAVINGPAESRLG